MRLLDLVGPAANLVDLQRSIDALPEIPILHGNLFAVSFPFPVADAPVLQPLSHGARDLSTGRDQRHRRRLIQRLQPADNRQQLQTFATDSEFNVGRFKTFTVCRFKSKIPTASLRFVFV